MTVEVADYITELNPSQPRGSHSRTEGDDHLRLIKKVIKQTFPNFTEAEGYVTEEVVDFLNEFAEQNRGLPSQAIVLYHGGLTPTGWAVCDGTQGTPNLKDRFPLGASADHEKGQAGGNNDIAYIGQVTEEHILTVEELPAHSHLVKGLAHKDDEGYGLKTQNVGDEENADHSMNLSSEETGGGEGHDHDWSYTGVGLNIPSFYAAVFIMKL